MELKKTRYIYSILFLFASTFLFARAGGGGGFGYRGGPLTTFLAYIIAPILFFYIGYVKVILERKRNKAKKFLSEIEKEDPLWNFRSMMERVEEAFFKIQIAWMERNQELAKEYMSERIYNKHKTQTDLLIQGKRKNILEKINLKEVMIFNAEDYRDNSKDSFSAHIHGSMIDYEIDESTGEIVSGIKTEVEDFKEIWHFIREGNKWVLDEIDQVVSLGDIRRGKTLREK